MKKRKFRLYTILKQAFNDFLDDRAMKLSASLSYYTIFSLAPILIVIMSLVGIFYGQEAVQGKVYGQIRGLVGNDAALQVQQIIQNIEHNKQGTVGAIIGVIILLIGATGVFTEIQDSINYIWSVKAKPKKGWLKVIFNRLLSFSLIISMGFILLVALIISALLDVLSERLMRVFADFTIYIFYGVNLMIIFIV
ncbi:MAG: YihY/virulence factor BrkB family protein, partial [Bacteroidota bacterium]|nr:YihY/virulence factor BrkB family protein [Bacteroidota bacterium]